MKRSEEKMQILQIFNFFLTKIVFSVCVPCSFVRPRASQPFYLPADDENPMMTMMMMMMKIMPARRCCRYLVFILYFVNSYYALFCFLGNT